MNEKNQDYLKNQVKYMGFGDSLEKELTAHLEKQAPEFNLQHVAQYGDDTATATLNFTKSKESDMYFFNSYDMALKNGGETTKQTFYVGNENNVTAKEAYNLVAGRSVFKEMTKMQMVGEGKDARMKPTEEKYEAWKQLNFKQTDDNGNFKQRLFFESHGYDADKVLQGFKFNEVEDGYDRNRIVDSLKKGNVTAVSTDVGDKMQKYFIEANPKDKTIIVYDSSMQRLDLEQTQKIKLSQGEKLMPDDVTSLKEGQKNDQKLKTGEEQNSKVSEKKRNQMKVS